MKTEADHSPFGLLTLPFLSFIRGILHMIISVKIKIESIIENLDSRGLIDGDPERSLTEANGTYRYSDGEAFINFNEQGEYGKIHTEIKCLGGTVTVRRDGAIESNMHFAEGESHHSLYVIAPYQFDSTVTAKRVRTDLTAEGGKIDLLYSMVLGGTEKNARMKIWISQASKQI